MGVYLSKPIKDKKYEDFGSLAKSAILRGAASSMQGWRVDQEDAHNVILDFDEGISYFGVYDGHGGSEVSRYIAENLPAFIKNHEKYSKDTIEANLKDIIVDFDRHLVEIETLKRLRRLSTDSAPSGYSEPTVAPLTAASEKDEIENLKEEAKLSIAEVLKRHYSQLSDEEGNGITEVNGGKRADGAMTTNSLLHDLMFKDADEDSDSSSGDDDDDVSFQSADSDEEEDDDDDDDGSDEVLEADEIPNGAHKIDAGNNSSSDSEDASSSDQMTDFVGALSDDEQNVRDDTPTQNAESSGPGFDSGSTAVIVLLLNGRRLVVANLGDSRCVLARRDEAVDLTQDHKPQDDCERLRIENAGGKITAEGRVNGGLNLSRALGDHSYKQRSDLSPIDQMISCEADIRAIDLDRTTDSFMIIACDGIWNCLSSQETVDFINSEMKTSNENCPDDSADKKLTKTSVKPLSAVCNKLFDLCLADDTSGDGTGCDNMTAILIEFDTTSTAL